MKKFERSGILLTSWNLIIFQEEFSRRLALELI